MHYLVLFCFLLARFICSSQTVVNGDFNGQALGWGCNAECNSYETSYGGSNSTNRVAEVDGFAGLCQTISGFSIGSSYSFEFDCSRRSNCGPAIQTMNVSVDGGALAPTNVTRTGGFGFTPESFTFVATSITHTIDFDGTISGTCGLVIDNVSINSVAVLPAELIDFSISKTENCEVDLSWRTGSEKDLDCFLLQRSSDGLYWQEIGSKKAAGNSTNTLHYSFTDVNPAQGVAYYRMNQVDINGDFSYSPVISSTIHCVNRSASPNPTKDYVDIRRGVKYSTISCFDHLGNDLTHDIRHHYDKYKRMAKIDLSNLISGTYLFVIDQQYYKVIKQ